MKGNVPLGWNGDDSEVRFALAFSLGCAMVANIFSMDLVNVTKTLSMRRGEVEMGRSGRTAHAGRWLPIRGQSFVQQPCFVRERIGRSAKSARGLSDTTRS